MTAQTYNRVTATVATSIFLILSLLLANFSNQDSPDVIQRRPSTFFTDSTGARALLLVMRRLLPSVEQWRRPLYLLPLPDQAGSASTLIVADPGRSISNREGQHLDRWLAAGGQLILLTGNGWLIGQGSVANDERPEEIVDGANENRADKSEKYLSRYAPSLAWAKPGKFKTGQASGSSVRSGELKLRWQRSFARVKDLNVIAAGNNEALAVEIPAGRGRIVAIADPTMISNGALRRSDNAVWLVTLAAAWGEGKILFDEFHHGFGAKRGTGELIRAFLATPWGWMVLQLAAAGFLYVFVYRRRFGRISEPPAAARASPLELVNARGGFLQAAAAQGLAAQLIVGELTRNLTKGRRKISTSTDLVDTLETWAPAGDAKPRVAALRALLAKTQNGEQLTDREFIELGAAAGDLIKGSQL